MINPLAVATMGILTGNRIDVLSIASKGFLTYYQSPTPTPPSGGGSWGEPWYPVIQDKKCKILDVRQDDEEVLMMVSIFLMEQRKNRF